MPEKRELLLRFYCIGHYLPGIISNGLFFYAQLKKINHFNGSLYLDFGLIYCLLSKRLIDSSLKISQMLSKVN